MLCSYLCIVPRAQCVVGTLASIALDHGIGGGCGYDRNGEEAVAVVVLVDRAKQSMYVLY
jgi:hypothetical protein